MAAQQAFSEAEARQKAAGWEEPEDDVEAIGYSSDGPRGPGSFTEDGWEDNLSNDDITDGSERVLLVGVTLKGQQLQQAAAARRRARGGGGGRGAWGAEGEEAEGGGWGEGSAAYTIEESLAELGRLAETAGLKVSMSHGLSHGRRGLVRSE